MSTQLRFQAGGSVRPDRLYVPRAADEELYTALRRNEFCYVLAPRQIGKSSLIARTSERLRRKGARCVNIDLQSINRHGLEAQWYAALIREITKQLHREAPQTTAVPPAASDAAGTEPPLYHWTAFLRSLTDTPEGGKGGPVVLFIDELDYLLGLPVSRDDFFASLRAVYSEQNGKPYAQRLTFCLVGAASPGELTRDGKRTVFNIGRSIRLEDFTREEAEWFLPALQQAWEPTALLNAIYAWTDGHPYMTQKLCEALSGDMLPGDAEEQVRQQVENLFLRQGRLEETSLSEVEKSFLPRKTTATSGDAPLSETQRAAMLQLYRRALQGEEIALDGSNPIHVRLRMTGIAAERRDERGNWLRVRNRVFATVFDLQWLASMEKGRRLADQVALWLNNKRDPDYLLRGKALEEAEDWLRSSKEVTPDEREFVIAAQEAARRYADARQKQAEAQVKKQRVALIGFAALSLALLALALFNRQLVKSKTKALQNADLEKQNAVTARNEAQTERDAAQNARNTAVTAERETKKALAREKIAHKLADSNERLAEENAAIANNNYFVAVQNENRAIAANARALRLQKKAEKNFIFARKEANLALERFNTAKEQTRIAKGLEKQLQAQLIKYQEANARMEIADVQNKNSIENLKRVAAELKTSQDQALGAEAAARQAAQDARAAESRAQQAVYIAHGQLATRLAKEPGREFDALQEGVTATAASLFTPLLAPPLAARQGLADAMGAAQKSLPFMQHHAALLACALSEDGTRAATLGEDQTLRVWDTRTGEQTPPDGYSLQNLPLLAQPGFVAFRGEDFINIRGIAEKLRSGQRPYTDITHYLSPRTMQLIKHIKDESRGKDDEKLRATLTQDFNRILRFSSIYALSTNLPASGNSPAQSLPPDAGAQAQGTERSPANRRWLETVFASEIVKRPFSIRSAALSWHGGKLLFALTGGSETAYLLDAQRMESPLAVLTHGGGASILSLAFSPDGSCVVTNGSDRVSRLWPAAARALNGMFARPLAVLRGHDKPVLFAAFSADSRFVVTTGADGLACVYRVEGGLLMHTLRHHTPVLSAAFPLVVPPDPAAYPLLTGGSDGRVRLWQIVMADKGQPGDFKGDRRPLLTLPDDAPSPAAVPLNSLGDVSAVAFLSGSPMRIAACGSDRVVRVWDVLGQPLRAGPLAALQGHTGSVIAIRPFAQDANRFLTASADGTARVWNLRSNSPAVPGDTSQTFRMMQDAVQLLKNLGPGPN